MDVSPQDTAENKRLSRELVYRDKLSARQQEVVDEFLDRASIQGERAVLYGRVTVATLILLRLVLFFGDDLAAGSPKSWTVFVGLVFTLFASWLVHRALKAEKVKREVYIYSTLNDVLVGCIGLYPLIIWPHDRYDGIFGEPDHAVFYLVMAASALRLSDRALVAGIGGTFMAVTGMMALDVSLNAARLHTTTGDVVLVIMFLIGAAVFTTGSSLFARQMVREGTVATLSAEKARQNLGVYVSETVARQLESIEEPALGGERRPVAVLFSDLRGFTQYSEKRDPEELLQELNAYLDAMVAAIHAEGGLVDKYIGDAIMAVYGLDDRDERDPAVGAIRTARAMQQTLDKHNQQREKKQLPPLKQGIGVHFGPVVAGNIGTFDRMQYTVLGDAVNTASRLESMTKAEGVSILVSKEAFDAATRAEDVRPLPQMELHGTLPIRGREEPLAVYKLS